MLAYHNDPSIKATYLARVQAHRAADQLIQGYGYWEDGKGCAVGCTIHSDRHSDYESLLGIPIMLARLEDRIFEGLPVEQARTWPERFLSAPAVGADLSLVGWQFLSWIVDTALDEFGNEAVRSACEPARSIMSRKASGEQVPTEECLEARRKARRRLRRRRRLRHPWEFLYPDVRKAAGAYGSGTAYT